MDNEEQKIKFLFDLYDINGNNTISYNEFLAIVNLWVNPALLFSSRRNDDNAEIA